METSISLADLINKDRLRAFVEEVSYLAAVPILVLDAGGEMLAKAGQLPTECPWLEEGFKIESTGSVVDLCTPRNCPFSRNQVCIPIEIQGNVVGHILSCSDSGNNRDNMLIATILTLSAIPIYLRFHNHPAENEQAE